MISHNHPRFADPSFQPDRMPIDPMMRPDTYDSTAVHDHSLWITCGECGTTKVDRIGQTCGICKSFHVRENQKQLDALNCEIAAILGFIPSRRSL
jgi:hypothetical protein